MKYLITSHKNNKEKQEIKEKGLFCYDLRHSDDGSEIATIEKSVVVNRVGSIITDKELKFGNTLQDDYIDFTEFASNNQEVDTIEEMLVTEKQKNKIVITKGTEIMEHKHNLNRSINNLYVIDVGYRNNIPIALVERTRRDNSKEYIIAFDYKVKTNKLFWNYGYCYMKDELEKAKEDFKRTLKGEQLENMFCDAYKEVNKINMPFYNMEEIRTIIKSKGEVLYAQEPDDYYGAYVRLEDVADFIIDLNNKNGVTDLYFYTLNNKTMEPDIATKGQYIEKITPELETKISDRLSKLQKGEVKLKRYKIIEKEMYDEVKNAIKQEQKKQNNKNKNREAR